MTLSIVIVNYNVRYFLEQCLKSVFSALKDLEAEVFVVDNHSVDGSVEMVREKFPQVQLIANEHNPGFAKANNQAIKLARGKYVLLLNPDTVVQENTFTASYEFMEKHPQAGALGITMIDGNGNYLPESKRGLPTPWVAFYKIFGLTKIFPKSKRFARYYLGHLSKDENQEIEILAGAYMWMRKSALDKIGLLDEDYFMYGEDIDLSYRFLKAGYQNYYLADSRIIHYKGESTKKGSLNYVFIFYRAMVIFAQKHFSARYAWFFSLFINLAIYLRASLSVLNRVVQQVWVPLLDAGILAAGLLYIKEYWEHNHRFIQGGEYPPELVRWAFPAYIALWLLGIFLNGGYDKSSKAIRIFKGLFAGTVAILVAYSLLPEEFRFSRAIIVLGALWAALSLPLWRIAFQRLFKLPVFARETGQKRLLLVGQGSELQRVKALITESGQNPSFTGFVNTATDLEEADSLGSLEDLPELCRVFAITEVVFCSANLSSAQIFERMGQLKHLDLELKIAPPESQFIIGSNSIHGQGSWYAVQFNAISTAANRRAKRLLDFGLAFFLLLLSPVLIGFQQNPSGYFANCLEVLIGQKSWVGYFTLARPSGLPPLKPGVLSVAQGLNYQHMKKSSLEKLNMLYAKNYQPQEDFNLIFSHFRQLGQRPAQS